MEKKDFSAPQSDNPSETEGIFTEDEGISEAVEGIEIVSPATTPKPSEQVGEPASLEVEGGTEGIEIDKQAFGEGALGESIGFAPSDDDLLPVMSIDDENLAFADLSAEPVKSDEDGKPKVVHKKIIRREGGGFIKGLSATIIYLVLVIAIGILSGLMIVSVANDIFAFTKDDTVYELTIDNPDMSLDELADYLHEEGIIQYPFIFRLYVGLKNEGELELQSGTVSLSPSYNYDKILVALNPPPVRGEISITFSEGLTIDDIIDIFVENGIGTREGFVDVIENYDFEYWFLEDLETTEERYYRLEGYLYPDTYRFYSDSSEVAALTKMLNNFNKKVPSTYRDRCTELGITIDEAVILASLIEEECVRINDFEYVSSVFHNRMASATFQGQLDSDATIQYILRHTTGERKAELTEEDLAIDSPYNTRLYKGMPPGPICNPSLNALMAAIYPNEETNYYYFVTQANGYNLYAETYSEHLKNVEQVRKESEQS